MTKAEALEKTKGLKFLKGSEPRLLDNRMDRLYKLGGFDSGEGRVLRYLIDPDASDYSGDVAESLALSAPKMTRVTDSLAEKGFIVRIQDESDRRRLRLKLTDEGRAAAALLNDFCRDFHAEVMAAFSAEEISTYFAVKSRMLSEMDARLAALEKNKNH